MRQGVVHGSGCAQLRADGSGRDVRGRDCARRPPVPVQDTALRIACGDKRGFAQAVLTNDAAVLAALPPFEQAGALSNRLLADKTRLWFGDISGAQRCTETLEHLCARLRGYAYIDRQGKDGVVRAGLVGPRLKNSARCAISPRWKIDDSHPINKMWRKIKCL